jgi:hypothetical protein
MPSSTLVSGFAVLGACLSFGSTLWSIARCALAQLSLDQLPYRAQVGLDIDLSASFMSRLPNFHMAIERGLGSAVATLVLSPLRLTPGVILEAAGELLGPAAKLGAPPLGPAARAPCL